MNITNLKKLYTQALKNGSQFIYFQNNELHINQVRHIIERHDQDNPEPEPIKNKEINVKTVHNNNKVLNGDDLKVAVNTLNKLWR